MKLGYTLCAIRRKKQELPINQVESFDDKEYDDMFALGAVRAPTDDEIALYRMTHLEAPADKIEPKGDGGKQPADKIEPKGDGGKQPAKASEKKSTDPDEIDLNV